MKKTEDTEKRKKQDGKEALQTLHQAALEGNNL